MCASHAAPGTVGGRRVPPRPDRWTTVVVLTAAAALAAGCGGDSTGPGSDPANGSMTARVDGTTWRAMLAVSALRNLNFISVTGIAADQTTINMAWPDNGTGTYSPVGAVGTNASYAHLQSGQHWMALLNTGTASITVTTITAERVAGTFSFTAPASPGSGASGTKTVSNGAFDIRF